MRVSVFSSQTYEQEFLQQANLEHDFELHFLPVRLNPDTVRLAEGSQAVSVFVNDQLDEQVLRSLQDLGVRVIALRCAGFNNVDLKTSDELQLDVVRVPAYSPYAVAEHTVGLMLALNRHLPRAYNRVRDGNFSLEGLMGFDLHGKCVGLVGTGKIGSLVARILHGFGCRIYAHDQYVHPACQDLGVEYVQMDELLQRSRVVSLHCPLTPDTHHLIDREALQLMQPGTMLVNTSRGGLIDTLAVIEALKTRHLGALAIDVYEEEADLFFQDLSGKVLQDDVFARLLTFPNVLITGHQAFFTQEAMTQIAEVTLANIATCLAGKTCENRVTYQDCVVRRN